MAQGLNLFGFTSFKYLSKRIHKHSHCFGYTQTLRILKTQQMMKTAPETLLVVYDFDQTISSDHIYHHLDSS